MGLSETEREHLRCILQQYEEDPRVLEMDQYIQHGCVTTYQHCRNVARVSFWINRRFHVGGGRDRPGRGRPAARFLSV